VPYVVKFRVLSQSSEETPDQAPEQWDRVTDGFYIHKKVLEKYNVLHLKVIACYN